MLTDNYVLRAPDRAIVESQRPARVVAATGEVHRASDALGVAYRRALRELGFAGDLNGAG